MTKEYDVDIVIRAAEFALVERIIAYLSDCWTAIPTSLRESLIADIRREFGPKPTRKVAGHKDTGAGL